MVRPALTKETVEQQRESALRAARTDFERGGLDAVTFRAVAGAIGMSPMALYRYFPGGRPEVLMVLRGRGFDELSSRFESVLARPGDPVDHLLLLTSALLDFATSDPDLYQLMFNLTQAEDGEAYLASRRTRAWKLASAPFLAAIDAHLLKADRELFPHLVFAAIHGAIVFELSEQPDPRRRLTRLIGPMLETLLAGSGASPATLSRVRRAFPSRADATVRRARSVRRGKKKGITS